MPFARTFMTKPTRRELLGYSSLLLLPTSSAVSARQSTSSTADALASNTHRCSDLVTPQEDPWREPGQTKDAGYLAKAALRYSAEGREIVGRNRSCFNNRPLYCEPETEGVVLAGDKPFVRLLAHPYVLGGFAAAIIRGGRGKWFHDYLEVKSSYRCGRMAWQIEDPSLPGVMIRLEVVPQVGVAGFGLRLSSEGLQRGDAVVWTFGGAREDGDVRLLWDPIMHGNPHVWKLGNPRKQEMDLGIDPHRCRGNRVSVDRQSFRLVPSEGATRIAVGTCSRSGRLFVADASTCVSPVSMANTKADQFPVACGIIALAPGRDELFWTVQAAVPDAALKRLTLARPARRFRNAVTYLQTVERMRVASPEPRLDAAVAAVCHPIDAGCDRHPYNFRHGCMAFSIHFLGWRVLAGATALGWHDRVKGAMLHYSQFQVKDDSDRIEARADPTRRHTVQSLESRFYGRGHISGDTRMYNTQSQFFDQIIRDWRSTADAELEAVLRPSLELHLEWARDCFDPDNDGLYESYINTLPTDSVWYNGGGSVEESAYAYYGHLAARDMAKRAGDLGAEARHRQRADKILQALNDVLWLKERGHFGLYIEQGGHQRVHTDAWVYSQFLPIDAGITTPEQALQALHYTEWGLERIPLPYGGEVCQPSNWVPWKWSVRDMFGGDLCALALAYFQTGLSDQGWNLLLGATLESAYASAVPGGFSHVGAGTDFGDNSHMFARTIAEGLFGYVPDYPNGIVHLRPSFPSSWPEASISTPDFSLHFRRENNTDTYIINLEKEAECECRLPICAEKLLQLSLDGHQVEWRVEPGFGCTWVHLLTPKLKLAKIVILVSGRLPQLLPIAVTGEIGDPLRLDTTRGEVVRWRNWEGIVDGSRVEASAMSGHFGTKPGHHVVFADIRVKELPQCQIFKLHVKASVKEAEIAARTPRNAPEGAQWKLVDLGRHYNGDIRTIFKQEYLHPRANTCSVRLGVDGYSAWTFAFWGDRPPEITLDAFATQTAGGGRLQTPQSVPFLPLTENRNIAFTSLWDNWPNSISIPIHQKADTIWLLICGSTFPMQTRITNAHVQFRYADGQIETLELVPPLNFWSLCSWGGADYNYDLDRFSLPEEPPPMVRLGTNCRAMVLSWKLRSGVSLRDLTLETLSQDVVVGLMGVSLMNPQR